MVNHIGVGRGLYVSGAGERLEEEDEPDPAHEIDPDRRGVGRRVDRQRDHALDVGGELQSQPSNSQRSRAEIAQKVA